MAMATTTTTTTRASRMESKLGRGLQPSVLEIEDVSYEHAGHAAMKESSAQGETHFNLKIVSHKFTGHTLVQRHRMVYDLLSDEFNSGLHALSILAQTPPPPTQPHH